MGEKDIKEGDTVSWQWSGSRPGGKVAEVKEKGEATVESHRGNTIKKNAEPGNPAVKVERSGNNVVKKASELKVDSKGDKHKEAPGEEKDAKDKDDDDKKDDKKKDAPKKGTKAGDKRKADDKDDDDKEKDDKKAKKDDKPKENGTKKGAKKDSAPKKETKKKEPKKAATESGEPRRSARNK